MRIAAIAFHRVCRDGLVFRKLNRLLVIPSEGANTLRSHLFMLARLAQTSLQDRRPNPLNAALWRLRRRGRGSWVISLDFTRVWTRRVGSGLEPEFGAGRVCG